MTTPPPPLAARLISIYAEHSESEDAIFMMALAIIRYFSGKFPYDFPGKFLATKGDDESLLSGEFLSKIQCLADGLFSMCDQQGFDVLIERLNTRDVRSVYFELAAASFFRKVGFNIEMRRETGYRGNDFDFSAHNTNHSINVEVSELTNDFFSFQTLKNKLSSKRNQVPSTHPAILFLTYPSQWLSTRHMSFAFMKTIFEFFGQSERINAVVMQTDLMNHIGDGYYWISQIHTYANNSARHIVDLDFLFKNMDGVDEAYLKNVRNPKLRDAFLLKESIRLDRRSPDLSFVTWINENFK